MFSLFFFLNEQNDEVIPYLKNIVKNYIWTSSIEYRHRGKKLAEEIFIFTTTEHTKKYKIS